MASSRGVRADQLDDVLHLQHASMPQIRHLSLVGAVGDELALAVLLDPARERQRSLMHVVLAVVVVALRILNAHREEFHQLAGIVLVGRIAGALIAIQVMEHRRINRDRGHQVVEAPHPHLAQQVVLLLHVVIVGLASHVAEAAGQHAMPEERHLLFERALRVDHAQQPLAHQLRGIRLIEGLRGEA